MKRIVSMSVALVLVLTFFTVPVMAEEEGSDGGAVGLLSFLNLSEKEMLSRKRAERPAYDYLIEHGVMELDKSGAPFQKVVFYDSLDSMLMGLMSGEVDALNVPDSTAKYLSGVNDQVKQISFYHPEKAEGFTQALLNRICNGYSFMMLEENSDLRDQFDQVIAEMKADGTLDELIKTHITDAAERGETNKIEFEQFDGAPIKVAVTGCLPPMDYVAANGTPAGFNTAVLAEIGKRLERNIELVQVDSVGRALALAQGNVDVAFWTRGASEGAVEDGLPSMSEEERNAFVQERRKNKAATEEEIAIMDNLRETFPSGAYDKGDMSEGTVVTAPYYTDLNVLVTLK